MLAGKAARWGAGCMYGRIETKKALTLIEAIISPYVGKTMAKASTQVHCEKLGIVAEEMTEKDVEALLDRLAKAMTVLSSARSRRNLRAY